MNTPADTRSYAFKAEELLLECSDKFAQYAAEHTAKAAAFDKLEDTDNAAKSRAKAQTNERMVNRISVFLETSELPVVQ